MSWSLIFGLALTTLLYAAALLTWRRKGLQAKRWYVTMGTCMVLLVGWVLVGLLAVLPQGTTAIIATITASLTFIFALQWRPVKSAS